MNQYNRLTSLSKALTAGLLSTGILLSATTQAAVSQAPLSQVEGVAPNMIFTLDDSSSMAWGHVPDERPWDTTKDWEYDSRRYRAANTNLMYYNPNVIYEIPPAFKSSGDEYNLVTSFTSAPVNGFSPSGKQGKVDLSKDYRVVREFKMPDGDFNRANHTSDWECEITGFSSNGTRACNGQIEFEIRRTSKTSTNWRGNTTTTVSCTATADLGVLTRDANCSMNGNTATATLSKTTGVPAYYYEFDPSLDSNCTGKKNELDGGGEACYRLRWVDGASAYDENRTRLKHADGTYVDGKQNFAIWYSFYKTRALATLSAAGLAFYSLDSNDVRFTWQSLNTCWDVGTVSSTTDNKCGVNKFRTYSKEHKLNFYDWLYNKTDFNYSKSGGKSGTPLRGSLKRAGEFLKEPIAWKKDPLNDSGPSYACRPSYHVLMTDGMWNVDEGSNGHSKIPAPAFPASSTGGLPDGKSYSKQAPYGNDYEPDLTGTYKDRALADYAFHYWATDLMDSIPNKVPTYSPYKNTNNEIEYWDPRNNPATWQHMSNFIMGLGLSSSLRGSPEWEGSTHAGSGYAGLIRNSNPTKWPRPGNQDPNNIYDLWHAALNSRGEFFSVDSPDAMVQAFNDILNRIASRKSTAAAPATSSSLESDGDSDDPQARLATYSYQSSFDNTADWIGELKKVKTYRQWIPSTDESSLGSFVERTDDVWTASEELPNAASRNIKFAVDGALQDFKTSNVHEDTDLRSWLNTNSETGGHTGAGDGRWVDRLNYIRGEQKKEGDGEKDFRVRTRVLGDFLASQPVVVQRPQYLERFSNRLEDNEAYSTFINGQKDRAGRLYIGANDGMLHAFDTSTGVETFAFIPTAVLPNLNKLTAKNYAHHYYVDGSSEVAEVYDPAESKWKTILVGTLRAGGKGLFALDVTTPGEEKLLWEFDEFNYKDKEGYSNNMVGPGYSFPKPTIARLHNGRWAVVTGNGYEGANTDTGKAALYIIDAITGKLKTLEVTSDSETSNGLSSPRLADYDADGVADYAYAGDLHGNLWRFDLLGSNASPERDLGQGPLYGDKNSASVDGFKVSYGGKPMFTATASANNNAPQPIMAAPNLTRHPSGTGYLVILGTGKYFEETDKTGTESHAQSIYGLWDRKTKAETTTTTGMPIVRDNLVQQSIKQTNLTSVGKDGLTLPARTLSNDAVNYYGNEGNAPKQGWYLDLAHGTSYEGEMMVENMQVLGNTLLISTLVPNDDPCAHGAGNWLYALNPATGGRTLNHAFTQSVVIDGTRTIVSAIKHGSEGGISVRQREDGSITTGDGQVEIDPYANNRGGRLRPGRSGGESTGARQGWRVIPQP